MADQRIRFSKTGRARYISHLDLMRTFQRGFLRADIHVKHTEGFNPHAYVSIALPLSVGFSSECEILEFGIPADMSREELPARLTAALPEGIEVSRCYDATRPMKQLTHVNYIITMDYADGVPAHAEQTIRELLGQESFVISKRSKKAKSGQVQLDLIPLVKKVNYDNTSSSLVLDAVFQAQNPGLNPSLLIGAIMEKCPELQPDFVSYHRKEVLDNELNTFE